MFNKSIKKRIILLLANTRFWILLTGFIFSINIAGIVQLLIPGGSLQIIRTQQIYGFTAMALLFSALLISPITKMFPNMPYREGVLHARRAIGVLSFYFALLHSWLAFYKQLGGFSGIPYYGPNYRWSILLGTVALSILFVMTITSLDWAVHILSFKRWKLLHRLVYIAGFSIVMHVVLIGSHYKRLGIIGLMTVVLVLILLYLELLRFRKFFIKKTKIRRR